MNYNLPVIIVRSEDGEYIARCEEIRATATGASPNEAVNNLQEAIKEMIQEFGEDAVFQDIMPETQVQVIQVAV
jgi:predicted RNase H-like HicB family nuclease